MTSPGHLQINAWRGPRPQTSSNVRSDYGRRCFSYPPRPEIAYCRRRAACQAIPAKSVLSAAKCFFQKAAVLAQRIFSAAHLPQGEKAQLTRVHSWRMSRGAVAEAERATGRRLSPLPAGGPGSGQGSCGARPRVPRPRAEKRGGCALRKRPWLPRPHDETKCTRAGHGDQAGQTGAVRRALALGPLATFVFFDPVCLRMAVGCTVGL